MFLKNSFLTFFQRKNSNNKTSPSSPPLPPAHATISNESQEAEDPQQQQEQEAPINNNQDEAIVKEENNYETQKEQQTHVPNKSTPPIIHVEFEQSRLLLQQLDHDFLSASTIQPQQLVSFPQFDHLLLKKTQSQPEQQQEEQGKEKTLKKKLSSRKLSATLRHRISLYRPPKNVKRTLSTPDLTSRQ